MATEELTDTRIPLNDGRYFVVSTSRDVTFTVYDDEDKRISSIEVEPPMQERRYRTWDPERDEPEYARVTNNTYYSHRAHLPEDAFAVAKTLETAAEFAKRLNVAAAPELEKQERAHKYAIAKREQEKAEHEQRVAAIKEHVQWYTGQKFKLRRKGYRATVFGVIDRVTDTHIYTTSERGVAMTTKLADLEELHVMYEGERRYTRVFPEK